MGLLTTRCKKIKEKMVELNITGFDITLLLTAFGTIIYVGVFIIVKKFG